MINIFIFEEDKVTRICQEIVPKSFAWDEIKYSRINAPFAFELGFYHWVLSDEKIIGVNFQILAPLDQFVENLEAFKMVEKVGGQFNCEVLLEEQRDWFIDYANEFVDFFLFTSEIKGFALSIRVPSHSDYDPSNLENKELHAAFGKKVK